MVLPLLAAYETGVKAYQGFKGILYIVMLILAIVVLAGAAQSKSSGLGKFNLFLSLLLFGATMVYPYINWVQPLFDKLGIGEDKRYFSLFIFYAVISFLIIQIADKNSEIVSGSEDTQNTNAKRAATGLLALSILILIAHKFMGMDLAFNVSEIISL